MKASIKHKLEQLKERHEELQYLLGDAEVISDSNKFMNLSKEYSKLEPVVKCFVDYCDAENNLAEAQSWLNDPELKDMAKDEIAQAQKSIDNLTHELQILMLPEDPFDDANIYLEVRAGTGGDEAAIFVGDLFRMYSRYAERRNWSIEINNSNEAEHGGYKEIIAKISGDRVYSQLKFESGAHRVQRVPVTESQGRIHTSACTVAIMPEVSEVEAIDINPQDLRIDTFRASGAGGQHVNKTDSAIRITHLPTNTVVECQEERSQHKNKAKAMAYLQSKLLVAEQEKQQSEQAQARKKLVGSGDRSERIRTYNYPQGRVTDHRINLTLYKLDEVMEGDLDPVIQPLLQEDQAEKLAELGDA